MLNTQALKVEPWCAFSSQQYAILFDDFVHDKLLAVGIRGKGTKSTINVRATVNHTEKKHTIYDEVSFWLYFQKGRSLFAKSGPFNYLRLQYDHGVTDIGGYKQNLYASLNTNKTFNLWQVKVGANHFSPHSNFDNRLKITKQDSGVQNVLYSRTMLNRDKFTFGLLGVYNITSKTLEKNDIMLGYRHNAWHTFFLRGEVENFRKKNKQQVHKVPYFDKIYADYIGVINRSTRVGLQVDYNFRKNCFGELTAVVEKRIVESRTVLKAKVNNSSDLVVSMRRPVPMFEDMITFTGSLQLKNSIHPNRKLNYGVKLDINI